MLKKMTIARRFSIILFLIFIFTFPLLTGGMYFFFRNNAVREISDKALLTMNSMESLRKYVGSELRPAVDRELPNRFVPEGQSGFYILRKVSYNLQEVQPHYRYKQASANPLARENKADAYEEQLLETFQRNPDTKELTGWRTDAGTSLYYIARPVVAAQKGCFRCHGNIEDAPKEQVVRYGIESGYRYVMNSVVGSNIIYVPASVPINIAIRSTAMVAVIFTALFLLLFVVINLLIRRSIIRPVEDLARTADQVSKGKFDNTFDVDTEDEIKTLADALNRLKTSIAMLMNMMKKPGS
jgi:HAMP domain-containing protein